MITKCKFYIIIFFSILVLINSLSYSPYTNEAWRFASFDIIPALGIMAFGKLCHDRENTIQMLVVKL